MSICAIFSFCSPSRFSFLLWQHLSFFKAKTKILSNCKNWIKKNKRKWTIGEVNDTSSSLLSMAIFIEIIDRWRWEINKNQLKNILSFQVNKDKRSIKNAKNKANLFYFIFCLNNETATCADQNRRRTRYISIKAR